MRNLVFVLIVLVSLAAMPVLAQSVISETEREALRGVPDRWGFALGSFWQAFDTKIRLDARNGDTGTEINFEEDLDLAPDQANFEVGAYYRFTDHSRLDFSYVGWNRSRSNTIEEQIEWGDVIYDIGVTLDTKTKGDLLNVIYKYSFINNGKVVFGVNGGISAMWNDVTLSGEGYVAGGAGASGTLVESSSTVFPIPVLGVHFEMTLTEKLFWEVEGHFFAANVADLDGNLRNLRTSISYYFTPHFGMGAGYSNIAYNVKKEGPNGGYLKVKYGFGGPVAYATFSF